MQLIPARQAIVLLFGLALGLSPVWAGERAPAAGSTAQRSVSARRVQAAASGTAQSPEPARAPVRVAQLDSHGRYPFGQFRGGYRYPFSYPYYRYGGSRGYPFGVGPYGPYGSNYGGYSGNAYDPRVYSRPPSDGRPLPDEPPAPPPADPAPPARAPQHNPAEAEDGRASSLHARPAPNAAQAYGDPVLYFGGNPNNPTYGGAPAFRAYPFGYYGNGMWFGQNRAPHGFGHYPTQVYNDPDGPPCGLGSHSPEYTPQYDNYNVRNYGPTYPALGGINGGPGYYQGW